MKRRSFLKLMGLAVVFPKTVLTKFGVEVKRRGICYLGKMGFYLGDRNKENYVAYDGNSLKIKGRITK